MATARQILANRRNAEKSTGPTSEGGKAASRANSLKHGLTGGGDVLTETDADEVEARLPHWRDSFGPINEQEEWLVRDVVVQSVRLERCRDYETAILSQHARDAEAAWDDSREEDARKLAAKLPGSPEVVAVTLRKTKHGCLLLIGLWQALAAAIESRGELNEAERSLALDLLGVPPALRDAPSQLDPRPGGDPKGHALGLIEEKVRSLESRITDYLSESDARHREFTAAWLSPFSSPEWRRLVGYENASRRRFDASWNRLVHTVPGPGGPRPPLTPPRPYPVSRWEPPEIPQAPSPEEVETRARALRESCPVEPPLPAAPAPVEAPPAPVAVPPEPPVVLRPSAMSKPWPLSEVLSAPRPANRAERLAEKALARRSRR